MRNIIAAAIYSLISVVFCLPLAGQSARPTFLYLLEGKGVPTGTIHVFSVNSSTGATTEVPGSPFNAGLVPNQLVVDPTGRFVYVTNDQSQDITAFSVDAVTGALSVLAGSPFPIGAQPVTAAVEPTGRFLYVFATSDYFGMDHELLYEYAIDGATGVLSVTSASPTTWEFGQGTLISSISFDAAGDHAYLGQVAGGNMGAPALICSVDFASGTLSLAGSVQPASLGEADQIAVSPNGNYLYSINTPFSKVNAFATTPGGGFFFEISGSPYPVPYGPSSLVVHPSGNFLYVTNSNSSFQAPPSTGPAAGSIYAFSIHSGKGALTQVPGSPFATGTKPLSIVVEPAGNFAYWTSTTANTPFAQMFASSIDPFSGVLSPFPGTSWKDSAQSSGGQLVVSYCPSTTIDPVPMISSLSPPSTIATAVPFTLQVNGANFVPGSRVYFGGKGRSTTFVSSTQLNASILGSDIDDGTAVVFVFNPLPGGGASTSVQFPVSALVPSISFINPSTVTTGGNPFSVAVVGSNFVASSAVNFNGTALATSYAGPNLIVAQIAQSQFAIPGTADISVTSPSNGVPGGGTSNTVTMTIVPPVAPFSVSTISPTSTTAGGPAFLLTVNGSGFVQGSQVSFNLNNVATTLVNSTQLTALIPASAIAIAGNPYVIVSNPDGTTSAAITFTVNNPPPGAGIVTPPGLPAGSNALTLNFTGSGLMPGSVVQVNGGARPTTYVSSTLLQVSLLPSDLMQSGTLNITVMTPPPGGGTTAAVAFPVAGYSVTPPSSPFPVTAGQAASFALTVSPSNGSFPNLVTFSVSTLPSGATASFAPSPAITPGATPQIVTLIIATTSHTASSTPHFPRPRGPFLLLVTVAGMAFAMAGLAIWTSPTRGRRLAPQLLFTLLLVAAAASLTACTGVVGEIPATSQPNPAAGTPAGTYPIIVTATSGEVSRSATVTLTVM